MTRVGLDGAPTPQGVGIKRSNKTHSPLPFRPLHPIGYRLIPERRNKKEESDSVPWMEKTAGDDKVLGAGEGLLESVVITASVFQEGGGGREPGPRSFISSVACP